VKKMRRLTLVLLMIVLWVSPVSAVDVLIPKDKAVIDTETVLVIGTGEPGSTVRVAVTGGGKARRTVARAGPRGQFSVSVRLEPGLNTLQLGGTARDIFAPGKKDRAPKGFARQRLHGGNISNCEDCHHPDMAVRGGGYPGVCLNCHVVEPQNPDFKGRFEDDRHFRASGSKCGKCHDPHGATDPKLLLAASEELCGTCHGAQEIPQDIHAAFEEGGCATCHDPHVSGYPSQLASTVQALCRECHDEVFTGGHGEELEECVMCHDPHAKMGGGLARGEFGEKCGECHEEVSDHASVHPAMEEGCETCHQPHSSEQRGMLRADQAELCGECHDAAEPGPREALHEAAETCTDCHGPHGGSNDKYLTASVPELCVECHEDPRENGSEIHPALEDGCLACHNPHTGYALGLLQEPETRICAECHDDLAAEGPHSEDLAGQGCVCCHEPHASDTNHFLREEAASFLENRKPCISNIQ
jgi:predicted CXXCH cytochrome family protein